MKHCVVYSHPNSKSFNHTIQEIYCESLRQAGHEVVLRDLYVLNFDPVLSARDFESLQKGEIPHDIKAEQEIIAASDCITFICPIWWGGLTANMRGYIDRVFSKGFAYDFGPGGLQKLLTGKKILFINTIGESQENYSNSGMFDSMNKTIDSVIADFTGIEVLPHRYFCSVTVCSDAERKQMLEEVRVIASSFHSNVT